MLDPREYYQQHSYSIQPMLSSLNEEEPDWVDAAMGEKLEKQSWERLHY